MPVDLDELGAARREALKEPHEVKFKGETFRLPDELDARILDFVRQFGGAASIADDPEKLREATEAIGTLSDVLLGDSAEGFMALHPSVMDLMALIDAMPKEYGMDEGESPASPPS